MKAGGVRHQDVPSASPTKVVFALKGAAPDPSTSRIRVIRFISQVSKPASPTGVNTGAMHEHTGHSHT